MTNTISVPAVPFDKVRARINRLWDPSERNPHHAIFAPSGGGKSYLIRHAILPIRAHARTVIVDVKADRDDTWKGFGAPVTELPRGFAGEGDGPAGMRYRLIVGRSDAKRQVREALEQILYEGHCVVVIDEARSVTDREQIGAGSIVERLVLEGRALGVSVILGAQSTAWAVSALKDQPAALWIGRMRHAAQVKSLAEIAGYGSELEPVIKGIKPRHFLYADAWEDDPIIGITKV